MKLELELGLELKVLLELQLAVPMELVMELVLQLVVLMELELQLEVLEMERCKIKKYHQRCWELRAINCYTVDSVDSAVHWLYSSTYAYIYC